MEIYKNKSIWKWLLGVLGFLIVIISMFYAQYLAKNLAEREIQSVELYADAIKSISTSEDVNGLVIESKITENFYSIPIILENEQGQLKGANYRSDGEEVTDQSFLQKKKEHILKNGYEPIEVTGYAKWIYYENSKLYRRISLFPLVQILLISTFMLFGYYVFSTSRKSEQNRVWAGMAKETAHQLGTPISAILGWIAHLKESAANDPEQMEVVNELRNDVTRLELIADRFSKIGSKPELKETDLVDKLLINKEYMERRAPAKVKFIFPEKTNPAVNVHINSHLFDWVIENLLRNALDSMEGKGQIEVDINQHKSYVEIDISDTGKGIPANKQKKVFEPGFTTKKRGWGLGLSLAKRIIEQYHKGKIFVKHSKINEGTTFSIQLPSV